MNITIARIRSNVTYTGPLETVLDSFFENYVKWMNDNSQHNFKTYNVSFGDGKPQRTPETIDWAEALVTIGVDDLDANVIDETLGALIKYREDQERIRSRGFDEVLSLVRQG